MTVFLANTFQCGPEVQLHIINEDHFHVETSSDDGSVHLEASLYPQGIWVDYFITADVYHESHDVLVIIYTFQEEGACSISVHFGALPNVLRDR